MNEPVVVNLKKIKLMGKLLIWVSAISAFLAVLVLFAVGLLYFTQGADFTFPSVDESSPEGSDASLSAISGKTLDLRRIFYTMLLSVGFACLFLVSLFIIGKSWSRGAPFSRQVVIALRIVGFGLLANSAVLFIAGKSSTLSTSTVIEMLNQSPYLVFSFIPLTALALLILAMSWVVEDGGNLEKIEDLTI